MASNITIKVDTEVLRSKAQEIQGQIGDIESQLKTLAGYMRQLKSSWRGPAGSNHYDMYQDYNEDLMEMVKGLKEYPKELLEMAGLYRETEEQAQGVAKSLATNILS